MQRRNRVASAEQFGLSRRVLLTYGARMTIFFTMVRRVRHRAVTASVGLAPAR